MYGPSVQKAALATKQLIFFHVDAYLHACMWNVVMCILSKINYEKENIQLMLSCGLKTITVLKKYSSVKLMAGFPG